MFASVDALTRKRTLTNVRPRPFFSSAESCAAFPPAARVVFTCPGGKVDACVEVEVEVGEREVGGVVLPSVRRYQAGTRGWTAAAVQVQVTAASSSEALKLKVAAKAREAGAKPHDY